MPLPQRVPPPILADVYRSPSDSSRNTTPSGSRTHGEVAQASPALWEKLTARRRARRKNTEAEDAEDDELETVGVAVEWPQDRRLGKGKERSLVVWVTQAVAEVSTKYTELPWLSDHHRLKVAGDPKP